MMNCYGPKGPAIFGHMARLEGKKKAFPKGSDYKNGPKGGKPLDKQSRFKNNQKLSPNKEHIQRKKRIICNEK